MSLKTVIRAVWSTELNIFVPNPKMIVRVLSIFEDMGYKVFFKNINLNYSIGKVRYRPWAEKADELPTTTRHLIKELLIVEKEKRRKPFDLHTSFEDEIQYYESLRKPYIIYFFLFSSDRRINKSSVIFITGTNSISTGAYLSLSN